MTRNDIADALAAQTKMSKAEAREIVTAVLDAVAAATARGPVSLAGFGKFSVTRRGARTGRNPRTGESLVIGPGCRIVFRAAKAFKDRVTG